jgi:hypothetical protein
VILVALFLTLRPSLPGRTSLLKGLSFGLMVWFLRVVMRVAGEWVTTTVPTATTRGKVSGVETLVVMMDPDAAWRVSGYLIQ